MLSMVRQVVAPYYARPRRTPPRTGTTLFVAGLNFITTERVRLRKCLWNVCNGVHPAVWEALAGQRWAVCFHVYLSRKHTNVSRARQCFIVAGSGLSSWHHEFASLWQKPVAKGTASSYLKPHLLRALCGAGGGGQIWQVRDVQGGAHCAQPAERGVARVRLRGDEV